jgi:2-dehydro-3-deoxyphosphooctonate aldolase (KDO 8-P synthase)
VIYVLGPCCMESRDLYLRTARRLHALLGPREWYYKASFDKANRTAASGGRGPGLEAGIELMRELKTQLPDLRLTTDVHECWQVEELIGVVDLVQVPAFLARQTDLLVECGRAFTRVHVKKAQFMSPDSAKHIPDKVRSAPDAKVQEVWIAERGVMFGYGQVIPDFGAVSTLKHAFDKVILDCTHSTQRRKGDFTGGDRELGERYWLASELLGYDGLFAEVHPNPPAALSDGDCQIYLTRVEALLETQQRIHRAL